MAIDRIQVQVDPLDAGALTRELTAGTTRHGAVVSFAGLVRDQAEHPVSALFLEHYPGMTESALAAIVAAARARWSLGPITLIHRVGTLRPGETIVFVGVTAAHRKSAFEACEFLIDFLKIKAPLWKKESTPDGEHWVASRASDCDAAQRWR